MANDGGILRRILRSDAPFPVEIEIQGQDMEAGFTYADGLLGRLRGLKDAQNRPLLLGLRPMYERNYPELHVQVDREKAGVLGITDWVDGWIARHFHSRLPSVRGGDFLKSHPSILFQEQRKQTQICFTIVRSILVALRWFSHAIHGEQR